MARVSQESQRGPQLLLGRTNLGSTVSHRGIEVDDALEMAEQTEVRRRNWSAIEVRSLTGREETVEYFFHGSHSIRTVGKHAG
jgi:hypothetical protein